MTTTGILRLLAVLALAAIVVLSVLTGDLKVRTAIPGPVTHLLAYATASGLFGLIYRDMPRRVWALMGLSATAFCLELVQWPLPGRDSSVADFLVSSAGACLGLGAVRLGEVLIGRSHPHAKRVHAFFNRRG